MNSGWPILVFFVLVALTVLVMGAVFERRRQKELAEFALRVGLSFSPGVANVHSAFDGYTPFGRGGSRRSSNLINGDRGGVAWQMFDYRYTTGGGKSRRTHRYGVVCARVWLAFPRVTIRPEGLFDKIASLAGYDDIDFQSEPFSRRYHVKSGDRKRVYDLIHPGMMEYLLSLPVMHWQLGPQRVLIVQQGKFKPAELERIMGTIEGFLARVPGHVRKELGAVDVMN